MSERPRRREHLCDLLWDVADDPRAALRWSLSRLRRVLDDRDAPRVEADRDGVRFVPAGAYVDVLAMRERLRPGVASLATEELVALADEFRGELVEGLELPEFHDFQAWCVAEREQVRRLHVQILRELVARLSGDPEAALPHARRLVQTETIDESARAGLVRLLGATGRRGEAEQQWISGARLLEELGARRTGELEAAWRQVAGGPRGDDARGGVETSAPASADGTSAPASALVGRDAERARVETALADVVREERASVLVITGEPGIGKTRLLDELRATARARGGVVLSGAAYEVESRRPYGPWIDALRRVPPEVMDAERGRRLAPLLPDRADVADAEATRERLFGAVVDVVEAACRRAPPVALAIDDVQWCDEASVALLHYVVRMSRDRPLLVVLAARSGEILDNTPVARTLRAFRRDGVLHEMRLGPLGPSDTERLVRSLVPDGADLVFERSGGNPLFALEIARAGAARDLEAGETLAEMVRDRLERLPLASADLLRWGAVLGSRFGTRELRRLSTLDESELVGALEVLERHSLLRPDDASGPGGESYAFAHDVVRGVVYGELSEPRRRLMHRRVAEVLRESPAGPDASGAATADQIAHHAGLAGDLVTAAEACLAAGRHCLRVFANREAEAFARRGLRFSESLGEPERVKLALDLSEVSLIARRPPEPVDAARTLEELAERALAHGCMEHARLGFHLLAHLRWEEGEWSDAQRQMMRAELASRTTDPRERAVALAEAARCLAMIERDLGRAEALLLESRALARGAGVEPFAVPITIGMLRLHQGRLEEAAVLFGDARRLSLREQDHLAEFQAIEQLVVVELQRERHVEAAVLAGELLRIGDKLREGSEAPFARALHALVRYASGEASASDDLDEAVADLRLADAKHRLAWTLRRAAEVDLARGEPRRALARATEALGAARALGRPSETVLARAVLARASIALSDRRGSEEHLAELGPEALRDVSAEARRAASAVAAPETRGGPP